MTYLTHNDLADPHDLPDPHDRASPADRALRAPDVENLCTLGECPVHGATAKFFFSSIALAKRARASMWTEFRQALRLISAGGCIECLTNPVPGQSQSLIVIAAVHRFEECIAGRDYLIEVSLVSKDRWRAYIVRLPGVPTALMPFYGRTPSEAARQLSDWLTRAHGAAKHA